MYKESNGGKDLKQTEVFERDYTSIKEALRSLIGHKITVSEHKTKNKIIVKKGVVTIVSDNLFCFDVPLGKTHIDSCSYTFYDIKMGKIEIKELILE